MTNQLGVPFPKSTGSGCCCRPCQTLAGCSLLGTGGISSDKGFYGLCCTCLPTRVCVSLWIQPEDNCGCADEYNDGTGPVYEVQVTWDCDTNSYSGELICVDPTRPKIDFRIGFEQDPPVDTDGGGFRSGNCYIVLQSDCLGYTWPNRIGDDNRIWIPMGGEYHDNSTRKTGCTEMTYEFDIDLSTCQNYECGPAQIKIVPSEHICRTLVSTGYWDGYDSCIYERVCVTYTPPEGSYDGDPQTTIVCQEAIGDGNGWKAYFDDVEGVEEFLVEILIDSESPITTLSVNGAAVVAECEMMTASWELESGATVSIKGDQRADCKDCQCWCKCLCVSYYNDATEGIFRGTLCWDEYLNNWAGELENAYVDDVDPISVSLLLECDECTGVTKLLLQSPTGDHYATIDCDDIQAEYIYEEYDESQTQVSVECQKCSECFAPIGISVFCCPDDLIPDILTATIEPDAADYDPGPPELPGNGSCTDADGTITLEYVGAEPSGGFIDEWWGSGFPFLGCPETRMDLRLSCKEQSGYLFKWQIEITVGADTQTLLSDFTECNPLEILFSKAFAGGTVTCCNPDPNVDPINNYKITVTV